MPSLSGLALKAVLRSVAKVAHAGLGANTIRVSTCGVAHLTGSRPRYWRLSRPRPVVFFARLAQVRPSSSVNYPKHSAAFKSGIALEPCLHHLPSIPYRTSTYRRGTSRRPCLSHRICFTARNLSYNADAGGDAGKSIVVSKSR